MKIVFNNLRKKIGYGRIVHINEKIAQISEQQEELSMYIDRAKQHSLLIAVQSASKFLAELELKKIQLIQKRKLILGKVFGGHDENSEEKE